MGGYLRMILAGWLVVASVVSAYWFIRDKRSARESGRRIPEARLHLWSALGGVFVQLLLMYTLRHKNRKSTFYRVTYAIFLIWALALGRLWQYLRS
jgi:uncharacterized membrane protein YsdA (DUF1294 family)